MSDAARASVAAGLRFLAMTLRSQSELLSSQAGTLERQADGIEAGTVVVPTRPVRLEVVEDDDESEPGRGVVEAMKLEREPLEGRPDRVMWATPTGEPLSGDMLEWLTQFDARITTGRPFIDAVNMAADDGMVLDKHTAAWVAAQACGLREREEQG